MKILVVNGSPRVGGNTARLAEEFARGAREAGNEVDIMQVGRMDIHGCMDCKHCFAHDGECIQLDDMQKLYPVMDAADMLVIASPVYFFAMTAQVKLFIDRLYAYAKKGFPTKHSALLLVCGDTDYDVLRPAMEAYKITAEQCGMEDWGIVTATGANAKGEIEGHGSLQKAYALGASVQ